MRRTVMIQKNDIQGLEELLGRARQMRSEGYRSSGCSSSGYNRIGSDRSYNRITSYCGGGC